VRNSIRRTSPGCVGIRFSRARNFHFRLRVAVSLPNASGSRWSAFFISLPPRHDGGQGVHDATFALGIPGRETFRTAVHVEKLLAEGESLLSAPPEVRKIPVLVSAACDQGEIVLGVNAGGTLASASLSVTARNFAEAEISACDLVLPLLSSFAFKFDVAVDIAGYEIVERRTDVRRFRFGMLERETVRT
jgi:hypothetical protein